MFKPKLPQGTFFIHEELAPLVVEIGAIDVWPINPNEGDVGAIAESLKKFGQTKPVVVQRSSNLICAGNHTFRAAQALGWSHIAAVHVPMDDKTAMAYAIADNRTRDRARYDDGVLASILIDLRAKDALTGTGFDGDDIDAIIERIARERNDPLGAQSGGVDTVPERYAVVVSCENETKQGALLERLTKEGYECRALIS